MTRAILLLLLTALAVAVALRLTGWRLPDRHNPWAPLVLSEPPNWLTRHKLARLDERPFTCREVLAAAALRTTPLPDRDTGAGGSTACGFRNAVTISRTAFAVNASFALSCRSAVALALWERHVVAPEALRLLGSPVHRLDHFGSYACRNVYGRSSGRPSQHATADALDVSGFLLKDGRRITVARDWEDQGPEGAFLRAVHRGACRFFDGVLGPEYNAAHADHLHLDRGPYRVCR